MCVVTEWVAWVGMVAAAAGVAAWLAGAIYFDVFGGGRPGRIAAAGWGVAVVTAFAAWQPLWQPFVALLAVTAGFLAWWLRRRPRHDREWDPSVAVLPRVAVDGDAVTIESLRDFDYPAAGVAVPRYATRTYRLAELRGMDVVFFNWGSRWMSHPALVFDFGPGGRVCFSIEVRYRAGQRFSVLRSLYRQQELIFVAADERDAILRRTRFTGGQTAHLYRLTATAAEARTAFLDYARAVNDIYDRPRWYHGLCANCTTGYYRLPNSRVRLDWRVLANGRLDRALYKDGRLDRSLPFDALKESAFLNDVANAAPEAGFGDHVRRELEGRRRGR